MFYLQVLAIALAIFGIVGILFIGAILGILFSSAINDLRREELENH